MLLRRGGGGGGSGGSYAVTYKDDASGTFLSSYSHHLNTYYFAFAE